MNIFLGSSDAIRFDVGRCTSDPLMAQYSRSRGPYIVSPLDGLCIGRSYLQAAALVPLDDWAGGAPPPLMKGKKVILTCFRGNK